MAYTKTVWEDYPSIDTPITADRLNNIENGIAGLLDYFYPVGTIYETTSTDLDTTTKMGTHFGGTWEVYGAGRVLVAKSADTEFDTIGETGGAKTHTLDTSQIPEHRHNLYSGYGGTGGITTNQSTTGITFDTQLVTAFVGGGLAHNNLQPYIVVYRYRRTV